tara:strand:- start:878 stop:1114 length:237 start_codon:yes stop_codon:yes gene_type:complete
VIGIPLVIMLSAEAGKAVGGMDAHAGGMNLFPSREQPRATPIPRPLPLQLCDGAGEWRETTRHVQPALLGWRRAEPLQ